MHREGECFIEVSDLLCSCTKEETLNYHHTRTSFQRFNLQTFRFIPKAEDVYIHCEVVVCHKSIPDSRCDKGCPSGKGGKRRRQTRLPFNVTTMETMETQKYYTKLGPLRILTDRFIVQPASGKTSEDKTPSKMKKLMYTSI